MMKVFTRPTSASVFFLKFKAGKIHRKPFPCWKIHRKNSTLSKSSNREWGNLPQAINRISNSLQDKAIYDQFLNE
jgi:hypothetical protein